MQNQKGFTLVELMVVVVILGILVAIAVPVYNNVTKQANQKAVEANLRTIDGAIMQYKAVNDGASPASGTPAATGWAKDYLQVWPTGPDGVTYEVGTGDNADKAIAKAKAGDGGTGSWFGTGDKTLPVSW